MGRTKGSKNGVRVLIKLNCIICNKEFYVINYKKNKAKYCSRKCKHISQKNYIPWNKGKKCPQFSGEKACNWKGGYRINTAGYVIIFKHNHPYQQQGCVKRSRLIVEKKIGRYLKPAEVVHHINGIKEDDRIENLIVFTSQSAHIRFHYNPENVKQEEIMFAMKLYLEQKIEEYSK